MKIGQEVFFCNPADRKTKLCIQKYNLLGGGNRECGKKKTVEQGKDLEQTQESNSVVLYSPHVVK